MTKAIPAGPKPDIESELATLQRNFGGFLQLIADLESCSCIQIEGHRKLLQFIDSLDLEVDFAQQYVEARLSKMPVFQAVLISGTLNPADYALIQNSAESNAAMERSFSSF